MAKFEIGQTVKISTPNEREFDGETGIIQKNNRPFEHSYEVMLDNESRGPYPYNFKESELSAFERPPVKPPRRPQTQEEVARAVIDFLLPRTTLSAFEYLGQPVYDGLTRVDIQAMMEEFRNRDEFGEKRS